MCSSPHTFSLSLLSLFFFSFLRFFPSFSFVFFISLFHSSSLRVKRTEKSMYKPGTGRTGAPKERKKERHSTHSCMHLRNTRSMVALNRHGQHPPTRRVFFCELWCACACVCVLISLSVLFFVLFCLQACCFAPSDHPCFLPVPLLIFASLTQIAPTDNPDSDANKGFCFSLKKKEKLFSSNLNVCVCVCLWLIFRALRFYILLFTYICLCFVAARFGLCVSSSMFGAVVSTIFFLVFVPLFCLLYLLVSARTLLLRFFLLFSVDGWQGRERACR